LIIGFITYGDTTAKYLPYFLASIFRQTFFGFDEIAVDNSEEQDNDNRRYIRKHYPKMEFHWAGKNLGFARANNIIIKKAAARGAKYVMLLNPDTIMEPETVQNMVNALEADPALGSVSAKIRHWDFKKNEKTAILDSCGIVLRPGLRFFDLGEAQEDKGQFDSTVILGPSGAAPMYRMAALEKIKFASPHGVDGEAQYFDELMFMGKEDCDLAYRLKLAGIKSKLVASAIVYHDRTTYGTGESDIKVALNRRHKSKQFKKWSFLYQHIIFVKYWKLQSIKEKIALIWYALEMLAFAVIFEQFLLPEYFRLWKFRNKINKYHSKFEIRN